jgi:uncharacterized membrane protein YgdD (TMEM256/DUF423 family)
MKVRDYVRLFIVFVGISGCFSVLFGAWLAHGTQTLAVSDVEKLRVAHLYQWLHTLALLAMVVWYRIDNRKILLIAGLMFVSGILLFSGGIYLKTLFLVPYIGKLTPIGGVAMAVGWLLLIFIGKDEL